MSAKITGLVWDLDNTVIDREEKYVLLAYADHADHNGYNIFPSIALIVQKTGYKERAAQMITHSLEAKGFLVEDGCGPKGTNKWRIPLDERGAKIAPLPKQGRVQNPKEGGATSSLGGGAPANAPEPSEPSEPSFGETPKKPLPLEWKIAAGLPITEEDLAAENHRKMVDTANRIATGFGATVMARAREIALAFQEAMNVVIPGGEVKGQRKAVQEMLEWKVTGAHVRGAVEKLTADHLPITDLFSVKRTAIGLANTAQKIQEREPLPDSVLALRQRRLERANA